MPAVGDRVGNYVITGTIGRGAMAGVFRAHDERLNRDVALKILDPGYSLDFIFRARFEREYGVTARLHNEHSVPVYDAGTWHDQLYIAMMLVEGPNLGEVMRDGGPLELARVVSIVTQVAEALDEAHSQRVVHRDVKPANILLTRHGSSETEHAYLADFGLTLGMEGTHLTRTGGFMGTLAYSSPEQLNSAPIDGRADEYALAATTYHMLAGVPPFQRDNEMALVNAQLFDPPPAVTDLRPDLPRQVANVISRAMAKLPEDRYRTAGEFAKALAASASAPLQAANPALVPGSGRLTTAAVVLGLLLVGGLGGVVVLGVLSDKSNPTTAPGTAGPPSSLVAGAAPTAPPTSATAPPTSATAGTPSPGFSPTPAPTTRPGRSPRPTHTAGANPTPQPATPTPPGPSPSPPPLDLPIVADGSWSVDNSPSGISGDPYVVVGAHQRRYRIVSHCLSETDCRIAVKTFDADSGASLGSISFRWNGDSYVFRGSARWYSRSGGSTCETSPGVLIDGAYTTGEQVHVAPRTNAGGLVVEMTGSKTITGTPTAAGSAAGCQPFSMTYDVDMNLSP